MMNEKHDSPNSAEDDRPLVKQVRVPYRVTFSDPFLCVAGLPCRQTPVLLTQTTF